MKINYNVTGADRKSLAGAISQELNAPVKYLGAPTFSYEVGGYTIDKTGVVSGPDDYGLVTAICTLHGIKAVSEEYDLPLSEPKEAEYPNTLTIEYPLEGFTPDKLDNLAKLVKAKALLIKAALGADELPIIQTADTLQFPWFWDEKILTSDEAEAYSTLISLLCKTAKRKKRITAKEEAIDGSPKYAMRCFLLSLGFIGDEHKMARRILLSRLEGSSAFKNGERSNKSEVATETQEN